MTKLDFPSIGIVCDAYSVLNYIFSWDFSPDPAERPDCVAPQAQTPCVVS